MCAVCCFPNKTSLQEPGNDSIVTDAVLSAEEQSRAFVNPAGTAAAAAASPAVADAPTAVPQEVCLPESPTSSGK